jgi:hypothetical protein
MTFQIRQSLDSAWYNDAMYEGLHSVEECERGFSRPWSERANCCDVNGLSNALISRETIAVLGATISKKKSFATLCGKSQDSLIAMNASMYRGAQ